MKFRVIIILYTVARSPILADKLRACLDQLHAENR